MKTQSAKAKGRWEGMYRQSKTPSEYLEQRSQKMPSGCIEFTGAGDKNGYGQCHASRAAKDLGVTRAHQMAYVVANGPIPEGKIVCHHCDNPRCINPDHLYAGTWQSNVHDCIRRGRYRTGGPPAKVPHKVVVSYHGKATCMEVGELLGLSYSRVCEIWRKHGLTGRIDQRDS